VTEMSWYTSSFKLDMFKNSLKYIFFARAMVTGCKQKQHR